MGYWIKRFHNQEYRGEDEEIRKGRASWRLSRQEGMIGAELGHNNKLLRIDGLGQYWQSDTYCSAVGGPQLTLLSRRIMRRLKESDCFYSILNTGDVYTVRFVNTADGEGYRPVPREWKNKWYVVEYRLTENAIVSYISGDKV